MALRDVLISHGRVVALQPRWLDDHRHQKIEQAKGADGLAVARSSVCDERRNESTDPTVDIGGYALNHSGKLMSADDA